MDHCSDQRKDPVIGSAGGTLQRFSPSWIVTRMWPQTLRCLWPIIKQSWVNTRSKHCCHTETPNRLWCGLAPNSCLRASCSGRMEVATRSNWWIPQWVSAALFTCSSMTALHAAVSIVAVHIQCGDFILILCSRLMNYWMFDNGLWSGRFPVYKLKPDWFYATQLGVGGESSMWAP